MYDITAQAVGYLGLIFGILAYQSNTHKKILLTKAASELFFGVQYVMLGAYAGMLTNLIGVIRNCTLSMPAIKSEYEDAVKEGVKFEWKTTVEAFQIGRAHV